MADAPEDCDGALPSTLDGVDGAALALHSRPASTSSEDPEGYSSRAVANTNHDGLVLDVGSNQEDVNHSQEPGGCCAIQTTTDFGLPSVGGA